MGAAPQIVPLVSQLEAGDGDLLAGDLGTIALKALLENGVGVVVSNFHLRSNPLDEAIAETESRLLLERGILLRRLRGGEGLGLLLGNPARVNAVATENSGELPLRHAVVVDGDRGMVGLLGRIGSISAAAPCAVICFDSAAVQLGADEAVLLDPEQQSAWGGPRDRPGVHDFRGDRPAGPWFWCVRAVSRCAAHCDARDNRTPAEGATAMAQPPIALAAACSAAAVDAVVNPRGVRALLGPVALFARVAAGDRDLGRSHSDPYDDDLRDRRSGRRRFSCSERFARSR